jgi:hypothetical protein
MAGPRDWINLPPNAYSKDVPPGWLGPGTEPSYEKYKKDIEDWLLLGGYNNESSSLAAIRMRLPVSIKETTQKFDEMPTPYDRDWAVHSGG